MTKSDEIIKALAEKSGKSIEEIEKEIENSDINAPTDPGIIARYENDGV